MMERVKKEMKMRKEPQEIKTCEEAAKVQEQPEVRQEPESRNSSRNVAAWSRKAYEGSYEDVDRPTYQRMMETRMYEKRLQ